MNNFLAIFIGGGLGSLLRYAISVWVGNHASGFPTATLLANFFACLVLGVAMFAFAQQLNLSPAYKSLILVGFCGGFSTFSTFSMETVRLIQHGRIGIAIAYVAISLLFCISLLFLLSRIFK